MDSHLKNVAIVQLGEAFILFFSFFLQFLFENEGESSITDRIPFMSIELLFFFHSLKMKLTEHCIKMR